MNMGLEDGKKMSLNRAVLVDKQFTTIVSTDALEAYYLDTQWPANFTHNDFHAILQAMFESRHFDLWSRHFKDKGVTHYTIGSCGHEGNAVLGHVFRQSDMAFLHYRSAAFQLARAHRFSERDPLLDMAYSFTASKDCPISGGRHKVLGSKELFIPPQTSTIASHCPKAVGTAFSLRLAKENKLKGELPHDAVILCSFGDASFNHSTAQGAFNAANFIARSNFPLPLIFICEDNGIGISVPTPSDWIEQAASTYPFWHYKQASFKNVLALWETLQTVEHIARVKRQPVFLHLKTTRLLGHAGSDVETLYLDEATVQEREKCDPLLYAAAAAVSHQIMSVEEVIALYEHARDDVEQAFIKAQQGAQHESAASVMSSIIPPAKSITKANVSETQREQAFGKVAKQLTMPRNMSQLINFALTDLMLEHDNMVIFGEDVAHKGGVYTVTKDLVARFSERRVFNTLLDEQTILGHAIGLAHNGFLPVPEIQFLAYLHNAEDQLRGEASTLPFFSSGQYTNPMVIRIPGLAYQKGFGGHFHNDNALGVIRDIPGVIVACPSNGADAVKMLRHCVHLAAVEQRVVVFLEPIALYMVKDCLPGDNAWLNTYPAQDEIIALGEVGVTGPADAKVAIVTFANGAYLSRQAIAELDCADRVKLIDCRWLAPLPEDALLAELSGVEKVLIVDETRRSGGVHESLVALLVESMAQCPKVVALCGQDCFIPLGNAWELVLPSKEDIKNQLVTLLETAKSAPI